MKTVLEIAKENGVTTQAVYQRIGKQKDKELKNCIKKGKKGETLINKCGEELLKLSFSKAVHSTVAQDVAKKSTQSLIGEGLSEPIFQNKMIETLKNQIISLEKDKEKLEEKLDKKEIQIAEKERKLDEKDQQIKEYFMIFAQMSGEIKKLQTVENTPEEKVDAVIEHRPDKVKPSFFPRITQFFQNKGRF
jgi:hypothetical protein